MSSKPTNRPLNPTILLSSVLFVFACSGPMAGEAGSNQELEDADGPDASLQAQPLNDMWFVGDSLIVGLRSAADLQFEDVEHREFRGKVGDSIQGRQPHFAAAASAQPDAVVIQAGINNVGGGYINVSDLNDAIGTAMDTLENVPCVVWGTYHTVYPRGPYQVLGEPKASLGGQSVSQRLNQLIREQAGLRPNVHVADFQPLADQHPYEWISSDGLHLSSTGYAKLAEQFESTIESECNLSNK